MKDYPIETLQEWFERQDNHGQDVVAQHNYYLFKRDLDSSKSASLRGDEIMEVDRYTRERN